jgi:hypothetical protein
MHIHPNENSSKHYHVDFQYDILFKSFQKFRLLYLQTDTQTRQHKFVQERENTLQPNITHVCCTDFRW